MRRVFTFAAPPCRIWTASGLSVEIIAREIGLFPSDLHDLTFGQYVMPLEPKVDAIRTSPRATVRAA